jgi:hypothetical protein
LQQPAGHQLTGGRQPVAQVGMGLFRCQIFS